MQMQRVLCQLQVLYMQADCMQCCNMHTQAGCKTKQRQSMRAKCCMPRPCRRGATGACKCQPLLCACRCSAARGSAARAPCTGCCGLQLAALTWLTIWCCCTIRFSLNSSDSTWTSYIAPHPPARKRSPAVRPPAERCRRPPGQEAPGHRRGRTGLSPAAAERTARRGGLRGAGGLPEMSTTLMAEARGNFSRRTRVTRASPSVREVKLRQGPHRRTSWGGERRGGRKTKEL